MSEQLLCLQTQPLTISPISTLFCLSLAFSASLFHVCPGIQGFCWSLPEDTLTGLTDTTERERTAHGQTLPPTLSTLGKDLPSSSTTHTHTQIHKEAFSHQITSIFFIPRYETISAELCPVKHFVASGNTSHMIRNVQMLSRNSQIWDIPAWALQLPNLEALRCLMFGRWHIKKQNGNASMIVNHLLH